jgi:hypothetical protein
VGSFDVFTYVGKSMSQVERESYKVFEFMEYAFEMDLLNLVTDWVRDAEGNYWFLGVKSYMLTQDGYNKKINKPSVLDREMLALNRLKRPAKSKYTFMIKLIVPCSRCLHKYKVFDIA